MLLYNEDATRFLLSPLVERALEALELSQQERQIVRLIMLGSSSAEIQSALHIRLGTLRTHKRHIFAKLGVHKQSQLVAMVLAKASESQETNSRDEIVVSSLGTPQWVRHPDGEYVSQEHLSAGYPGT